MEVPGSTLDDAILQAENQQEIAHKGKVPNKVCKVCGAENELARKICKSCKGMFLKDKVEQLGKLKRAKPQRMHDEKRTYKRRADYMFVNQNCESLIFAYHKNEDRDSIWWYSPPGSFGEEFMQSKFGLKAYNLWKAFMEKKKSLQTLKASQGRGSLATSAMTSSSLSTVATSHISTPLVSSISVTSTGQAQMTTALVSGLPLASTSTAVNTGQLRMSTVPVSSVSPASVSYVGCSRQPGMSTASGLNITFASTSTTVNTGQLRMGTLPVSSVSPASVSSVQYVRQPGMSIASGLSQASRPVKLLKLDLNALQGNFQLAAVLGRLLKK